MEKVDCQSYQAVGCYDAPGLDAYYTVIEGAEVVFYDAERTWERVRFTLAHELGHKVLGHRKDDTLTKWEQEKEADTFAAELLCPQPLVHLAGITTAAEVRDTFDVSNECAKIVIQRQSYFNPQDWPYYMDMFSRRLDRFIAAKKNLKRKANPFSRFVLQEW